MNLYDIHPDPKNAPGYATRYEDVPELVWAAYEGQHQELKKREKVLAKEGRYAYLYAREVLQGPFPAGEAAIATDVHYAYLYAAGVLNAPFPAGEAAIATNAEHSYYYARYVLERPFPAGETGIGTNPMYARNYALHVLHLYQEEANLWKGP